MKILIDMNLSPQWVPVLHDAGWEAIHWSAVGCGDASDSEILGWAKENQHVVFTHDLDFGTIIAATQADSPSVIQVRTQDVSPHNLKDLLLPVLSRSRKELERGVLIIVDEKKSRVRILPLAPKE